MAEGTPDVTLGTLHEDLVDLKGEVRGLRGDVGGVRGEITGLRGDVADLKATIVAGFARLPTREHHEEVLDFLREFNRLQDVRFTALDGLLRTQHLENQQLMRALADSHRRLVDENRGVSGDIKSLSGDIKALIARIDAIIRGRNNGAPGE